MKYFNVFMRNGHITDIKEYDSVHQRNMELVDAQLKHAAHVAYSKNDMMFDPYTTVTAFDKIEGLEME